MAFNICTTGPCSITITDLNQELYSDSTILQKHSYPYLQSVTINVLTHLSSEDERTLVASEITEHFVSVSDATGVETYVTDEAEMTFGNDGLYEVKHIILPTKEYILNNLSDQLFDIYPSGVYFVDDETLFKLVRTDNLVKHHSHHHHEHYCIDHKHEKPQHIYDELSEGFSVRLVEIDELSERNAEGTTIFEEVKNTFSICHLKECFNRICKDLLNKLCGTCNGATEYATDIYNRDIIWMALNVIKYCLELGQYYEAQRILEQVSSCGEICSQYDRQPLKAKSCGCNN